MERIDFEDWKRLRLKVGKILEVQRVPKTDKLYRLQVNVGTDKPMQMGIRGARTVIRTVRRTSGCNLREESTGDVVLSVLI